MMNMIKYRVGIIILTLSVAALLIFGFNIVFLDKPLDYRIFRSGDGWGYDIVYKTERIIHQPHIPATSGIRPFPTRQSAVNTARMVMAKVAQREFPTLSRREIDSLLVYVP